MFRESDKGHVFSVDLNTGATTQGAQLTGSPCTSCSGATSGLSAATTDPTTGVIYASIIDPSASGDAVGAPARAMARGTTSAVTPASYLVTVNPVTGVITPVSTTSIGIDAIEIVDASGVPAVSTIVLTALALVFVAIAVWKLQ